MTQQQNHAVWRADKKNPGEWLLFGPANLLKDRRGPIPVKRQDGTIEHRRVIWSSKPFDISGVPHCYARSEEKRPCEACGQMHLRAEVLGLNGKHRDVRWCQGETDCNCGGLLEKGGA